MHIRIVLIFACLLATACTSFFYYPSHQDLNDPQKYDLEPQVFWIKTPSGKEINAWYFASKIQPAKGTLVYFHGNSANLSSQFTQLAWLPNEGYNYLIFDFPGYGLSRGQPTPESCVQSGEATLAWVYENIDRRPIIYGASLGGIVAQRVAQDMNGKVPYRGVILDSTFRSFRGIAQDTLANSIIFWPFQWFPSIVISDEWAPRGRLHLAPVPVLVIHGQSDRTVPPRHGDDVYAHLDEPKEFWRIDHGAHLEVFNDGQAVYRKKFLNWLARLP
jgi:uncharacterized protein